MSSIVASRIRWLKRPHTLRSLWPSDPSLALVDTALVPVVDLHVVRVGGTLSGFEKRLETQQKDGPLCAAVVHEFHGCLPTLVFEEDDRVVTILLEVTTPV